MLNLLAEVDIGQQTIIKPDGTPVSSYTNFGTLISIFVKNSITIAGIIFVILLILGGFSFIMAAGGNDPKKTQQASQTITAALIGFVVVFLSYAIIQLIETITGLQILNSGL